jgi:adenylate kinase family enzyme
VNTLKIHIIGGPGSGKTYIAKTLAGKLKIQKYELDQLFWDSESLYQGSQTSPAKREIMLNEILEKDKWIIEGMYFRWVEESFRRADYILVLKTNLLVRRWRIVKRFFMRKAKLIPSQRRETMRTLLDTLIWTSKYDDHDLVEAVKLLKKHNDKVLILTRNKDIHKVFKW